MVRMVSAPATAPTAAERVRSAWARAQSLLAVAGADPVAAPLGHLLDDGSVAIAIAADQAPPVGVAAASTQAMLELTDHAPLPLRMSVRTLVWVRGCLQPVPPDDIAVLLDRIAEQDPNPALLQVRSLRSAAGNLALLRLTIESVVMADATGAESIPVTELLSARPDPLCDIEASWLRHLNSAHPEILARLAGRLPARLQRGRVRPLGVDRYGVLLRVEGADGDHDVRVPFGTPVDDMAGLNRAVRLLLGCPFRNGLHARRP